MNRYITLAACGALLAACANTPQQPQPSQAQSSDPPADKRYVTGSRIPIKDAAGSGAVTGTGDQREIDKMMQRGTIYTGPPPGR